MGAEIQRDMAQGLSKKREVVGKQKGKGLNKRKFDKVYNRNKRRAPLKRNASRSETESSQEESSEEEKSSEGESSEDERNRARTRRSPARTRNPARTRRNPARTSQVKSLVMFSLP